MLNFSRMRRDRGLPPPVNDPARVTAQRDAYLLARGRRVADGQDLGQVSDQDLTTLGYLDAVAQSPALPPTTAVDLEQIVSERVQASAYTDQDRARLRILNLDLDRAAVYETAALAASSQLEGLDQANGHSLGQSSGLGQDQGSGQSSQASPDSGTTVRSRILDHPRPDRGEPEQGDTVARGVEKPDDPIATYLLGADDEPDEDWEPA